MSCRRVVSVQRWRLRAPWLAVSGLGRPFSLLSALCVSIRAAWWGGRLAIAVGRPFANRGD
jgi:hypothetical protein